MEFIAMYFVPLMALCVLVFLGGIALWILGKLIQWRGNKKLRYHLARLSPEEREQILIEYGHYDL